MSERPSFDPGEREKSFAEKKMVRTIIIKGSFLARTHPELAQDALASMTNAEIAEKYNVARDYQVAPDIAKRIVAQALVHLLDSEVRLARAATVVDGVREKNKIEKSGLFGLTKKELADAGAKGGRKSRDYSGAGGTASHERRVGIFAKSSEELRVQAGRSHINRPDRWFGGTIVDRVDEGNYALALAKNPAYFHTSGKHAGAPDQVKILQAVIERYGNNRTLKQMHEFFSRCRDVK